MALLQAETFVAILFLIVYNYMFSMPNLLCPLLSFLSFIFSKISVLVGIGTGNLIINRDNTTIGN